MATWKTHFTRTAGNEWVDSLYRFGHPIGNVLYVSSVGGTNSSSYGYSPESPLASIAYAFSASRVVANRNDVIVCLPDHVETIVGAAGVAANVAGVRIIGVPGLPREKMPKINFTTAVGASLDISAAGVTLENLWLNCGIDAQTSMINVTAADVLIKDCEFTFASASAQAAAVITGTSAADRLTIVGNKMIGTTDAGCAQAISLVGGNDQVIRGNTIIGAFTTTLGGVVVATTDALRMLIADNVIANMTASSTKAIVLTASSTGAIVNNRLHILSGTAPITAAAGYVGGNYYSAAAGVAAGTLV